MAATRPIGNLLREWRQRRRLSQLELALEAEISTRHLSFLETGRSQPSREMLLHLAEQLEIPLRHRNVLLNAAGFAAIFPERKLNDPELVRVREAVDVVLKAHLPFPALAIDRHWTLVASNGALKPLLRGVKADLLEEPLNVLRLTLHPSGLAPRLGNYHEWRAHTLAKLRRQVAVSGDPVLADLLEELRRFAPPDGVGPKPTPSESNGDPQRLVVPFQLVTDAGTVSFFSTTTVFGTAVDVTLSELSLELFYPADANTVEVIRRMVKSAAQ
jgi:transcriptional regulator with XRE-family HTH domain